MNIAAAFPAEDDSTAFLKRLLRSQRFTEVYREVMAVVEQCAAYLDGDGRKQAASLGREAQVHYARTSMWLTTGLMRSASVVLVLRSAGSGEMTFDAAMTEIDKSRHVNVTPLSDMDGMPARLTEIVTAHLKASAAVERLMETVTRSLEPVRGTSSPVHLSLKTIEEGMGAVRGF